MLILLCAMNTNGQQQWKQQQDLLFKKLQSAKEDSLKVDLQLTIGNNYEANNPDSAVYYYNAANVLSNKLEYNHGKIRYLACMIEILETQAKYGDALKLCMQSIQLAKKLNRRHLLAGAYNNTASIYDDLGERQNALQYYQYAVVLYQQLNTYADSANLATVYGNILSIYTSLEQPAKAYQYGIKTLALSRAAKNTDALVVAYENFASVLIKMNRSDTAMVLIKQQYQLCKQINDKVHALNALANMNAILLNTGKPGAVKQNAEEMLQLAQAAKDVSGQALANYYLSAYYFKIKDYKTAKEFGEKALKIVTDNRIKNIDLHILLSDIALATGDLVTYRTQRKIGDSLRDRELSDKILKYNQELQVQYAVSKKEAEIENLHKQHEIQKLKISRQKTTSWILVTSVGVLIIIGLLYYRVFRQKNKLLVAEDLIKQQRIAELENEQKLLSTVTMLHSQEEERKRIAKDLHDGLGGILSGAKFSLSSMKQNFILTDENVRTFERTMDMLDHSIAELRRVAHNMMPESLLKLTFDEALMDYCQQITNSGALVVTYQSFGMQDVNFDNALKIAVYRITQELINNIIKHAHASYGIVQLIVKEGELNITVEDDGRGFDIKSLGETKGIGYKSLMSRIDFLNGKFDIQSGKEKGTYVYIEIPLI